MGLIDRINNKVRMRVEENAFLTEKKEDMYPYHLNCDGYYLKTGDDIEKCTACGKTNIDEDEIFRPVGYIWIEVPTPWYKWWWNHWKDVVKEIVGI